MNYLIVAVELFRQYLTDTLIFTQTAKDIIFATGDFQRQAKEIEF